MLDNVMMDRAQARYEMQGYRLYESLCQQAEEDEDEGEPLEFNETRGEE